MAELPTVDARLAAERLRPQVEEWTRIGASDLMLPLADVAAVLAALDATAADVADTELALERANRAITTLEARAQRAERRSAARAVSTGEVEAIRARLAQGTRTGVLTDVDVLLTAYDRERAAHDREGAACARLRREYERLARIVGEVAESLVGGAAESEHFSAGHLPAVAQHYAERADLLRLAERVRALSTRGGA